MFEISKSDWKLYTERIPLWQEKYMDKLVKEYIQLLTGNEKSSSKIWELDEKLKNDKKSKGVSMYLKKSTMVQDVCEMLEDEIIQLEDLDDFSQDFKDAIAFIYE